MNDEIKDLIYRAHKALDMGYYALAASKLRVAAMRSQNIADKLQKERLLTKNDFPAIHFDALDDDKEN